MKTTVVIYGSSTGCCETIAQTIGTKLGAEVMNVTDLTADVIAAHDNLILGTSTWGIGEMQDDWYDGVKVIKQCGLAGKTVALFGCGDCESYCDSFCGGMRELHDACADAGAEIVGAVSADGYNYDDSEAVIDGQFVGLALDDVNEDDKTEGRIDAWIEDIKNKL